MKFSLILILLAFVVVSSSKKLSKDEEDKIVENYFEKFGKRGGRSSLDTEKLRKNILKRFNEVEEHNEKFKRGEETYEKVLNKFSQLDEEDLKNLGGIDLTEEVPPPSGNFSYPRIIEERRGRTTPLANWNWATKGSMVQPVQDQGYCGSCYVFAAVAALEGSLCRMYNECTKISEQEAMECSNGCNNGWDYYVYDYITNYGGAAYASNYGYTPYTRNSCSAHGNRVPNSKIYTYTVRPNDPEDLKTFIFQVGPVFAAYYLYDSFYSYGGGIYSGCSGDKVGAHAILITGYGEENGVKYWIAKNSWGKNWGENGYFRIRRGDDHCRIESWKVSFPYSQ